MLLRCWNYHNQELRGRAMQRWNRPRRRGLWLAGGFVSERKEKTGQEYEDSKLETPSVTGISSHCQVEEALLRSYQRNRKDQVPSSFFSLPVFFWFPTMSMSMSMSMTMSELNREQLDKLKCSFLSLSTRITKQSTEGWF